MTNLADLTPVFTSDVIDKGTRYFSAKRVSRIEFDPIYSNISGIVKENDNTLLAVKVNIKVLENNRITLENSCDCAGTMPCYHIAALLIAIGGKETILSFIGEVAEQESYFRRHPEARPAPPAAPVPAMVNRAAANEPLVAEPLPWGLKDWQTQLRQVQESADGELDSGRKASENSRIIYLLTPVQDDRSLHISIYRATLKKNGLPGALKAYDPFYLRKYSSCVKPEDVYIFRMFMGFQAQDGYRRLLISDEFSTQALEKMVATGRCHFATSHNLPLTWGEPRQAKADWITESDMRQRTTITVEPTAQVFMGSPMVYVDVQANTIGSLKMDVSAAVARKWLLAPPVEPRFHKAVAQFSTSLHLPAPPPIPEAQVVDETPLPVLKLHSALWRGAAGFDDEFYAEFDDFVHWGELYFDYGPIRVQVGSDDRTLDKFINGKRYLAVRDPRLEQHRTEGLNATGLSRKNRYDLFVPNRTFTPYVWTLTKGSLENWQKWFSGPMKQLEEAGWRIEYDVSCKLRRAEVDDWFMDTSLADSSDTDWFNIDLGIVVDGVRISLVPLLRKLFVAQGDLSSDRFLKTPLDVPLPDGRYVRLKPERLSRIRDLLMELFQANTDPSAALRTDRLRAAQFAGVDGWHWSGSSQIRDLIERIRTAATTPTDPPPGLAATLRPYQQYGLTWLQFLREFDLSGILADDMGLGKTVQALAHLLCEKQAGRLDRPALVVAPTSLMGNWRQETQRFAPDLRVLVLHGAGRKEHFEQLDQHDLIVTSYQLLARDQEFLTKQPYHLVILDEAQMVKNPSTLYAQAARRLVTRHRLALTGTPMENHLGELWAIFDFLMPGFLGNNRQFRQLFRDPIEKAGDSSRRKVLAQRIAPLVLRRRKNEVALELPPKNEMVQEIELSGAQRDLYESIRVTMESHVRDQIANMGLARSHIFILEALLKLRQVCCDPRLLKLASAKKVTESAKLDWLVQTLPSMIEDGRKILLFSQFTSMLELIEKKLAELKIKYVRLTGDTRDRDTPVQSFQRGEVPLFLISLKAGGTGLNLTAADTVIHYDPWWNPAVENQATDRAHRIGQDKTVFVYKLITQGTVEEKIQALQQRKRALVAGLLDDTGQTPLKLGDEELKALFAPLT